MDGWTIVGLVIGGMLALSLAIGFREKYRAYFSRLDARSAALAEASHGAALIALAALAWLRLGHMLPAWFPLAALAVMIWGGLRLFNGAKFSVGWRDPKLIAAALIKAGTGAAIYVVIWVWPALLPLEAAAVIAALLYTIAPYGEWAVLAVVVWCVVTGLTKLLLVLRGFPSVPPVDPGMPHGGAKFSNPDDPGWKL